MLDEEQNREDPTMDRSVAKILKQEKKLEKKREKRESKGLFSGDIQEKEKKLSDKLSEKGYSMEELLSKEREAAAEERSVAASYSEAGIQSETSLSGDTSKLCEDQNTDQNADQSAEQSIDHAVAAESSVSSDESGAEASENAGGELAVAVDEEAEGDKKKRRKKRKSDVKPEEVNIVRDLLSLIIYIGIVVLICFLIVTYVGRRTTVHGDSMEPTLQSGDSLWVNMIGYRFSDPERFDIIVFPFQDDVHYIKRIIGLPGETIQIKDGDILINGKILKEPYNFDRIRNPGIAESPITLGEDEYFVMGDNRNNSKDSRFAVVGPVKREKIIGKAVFRLTPLKKFGGLE